MERYITSVVNSNINIFLQQAMFDALNKVDKELDYLQIFNLKSYEKRFNHNRTPPRAT